MRLLISGGGTGGHVYPLLAVVDALRQDGWPRGSEPFVPAAGAPATGSNPPAPREWPASAAVSPAPGDVWRKKPAPAAHDASRGDADALALLYVGMADSVEQALTSRAAIPFRTVESGQVRGMAPWVAARNLLKAAAGVRHAAGLVRQFRPDVVLITGGFVAGPVALAAWRTKTPLVIYLPDVEPGLTIRRMSRLACRVAVTFPETTAHFAPGKAVVTGYPVRQEIIALAGQQAAARSRLQLDPNLPVLLVFGGSRGARSINQALAAALPQLLPHCQVLHISGALDWPEVEGRAARLPDDLRVRYHAYPYLHDEMPAALAAADLVIARAGASTLGEFPVLGLPSILVPYPYSGQHQNANAGYLAQRGAAIRLADDALAAELAPTVLRLLHTPGELAAMHAAALALARPQAAQAIAAELRRCADSPRQ